MVLSPLFWVRLSVRHIWQPWVLGCGRLGSPVPSLTKAMGSFYCNPAPSPGINATTPLFPSPCCNECSPKPSLYRLSVCSLVGMEGKDLGGISWPCHMAAAPLPSSVLPSVLRAFSDLFSDHSAGFVDRLQRDTDFLSFCDPMNCPDSLQSSQFVISSQHSLLTRVTLHPPRVGVCAFLAGT